ncbi:MAG TPA: ABC transporter substrate-binding protein [Candidatus Binatia bacterium]|nr:ABC transporter substrate-binding protein [Candidatus Binatia bacterium]
MRRFLHIVSIVVAVITASPFFEIEEATAAAPGLTKIRVGYPSPSASMYPLFATKEAGLFEKHGLDAELIYIQGVQMVHVHVAGQLDFTGTSGIVSLQSSVGGADLILLANSIDTHLLKIIAHPSISGPAALKGKSIGITRFGSLTDLAVRPVLEKWKLEPGKDVTLVQIGRLSDLLPAVLQKKVDAGVFSFPSSLHAEKAGLRPLYDLAESGIEVPTTTVAVSRQYAKAKRDLVLRYLRAYLEGTHRLLTDREMGIKALRRYGGVQDTELLAATYDLFSSKYIKKVPTLTPKAVQNALNLLAETNPKAKNRKPEEFMDTSFMEELEKSGFIKKLWQ